MKGGIYFWFLVLVVYWLCLFIFFYLAVPSVFLPLLFPQHLTSSSESTPRTSDAHFGGQLSSPLRKSFHRRTSLQPLMKSIPDLRKGIPHKNKDPTRHRLSFSPREGILKNNCTPNNLLHPHLKKKFIAPPPPVS